MNKQKLESYSLITKHVYMKTALMAEAAIKNLKDQHVGNMYMKQGIYESHVYVFRVCLTRLKYVYRTV